MSAQCATHARLPLLCVAGRFDCSVGCRSVWCPVATRWQWGSRTSSTRPNTCTLHSYSLAFRCFWVLVCISALTCSLPLRRTGRRNSSLPTRSIQTPPASPPSGSACLGWRTLGSWPADESQLILEQAFSAAENSALVLEVRHEYTSSQIQSIN